MKNTFVYINNILSYKTKLKSNNLKFKVEKWVLWPFTFNS